MKKKEKKWSLDRNKTEDVGWNVYLGDTLTCADSGEPINVERIE